jgi:hypothetical protein
MKLVITAPILNIKNARKDTNCPKTVDKPGVRVSTPVAPKPNRSLKSSRESVEETTRVRVTMTKPVWSFLRIKSFIGKYALLILVH